MRILHPDSRRRYSKLYAITLEPACRLWLKFYEHLVYDSPPLPSPECVKKLNEHLVTFKQNQPFCVLIKKQNLVVDYWWQQKMITDCMLWFQLSGIMCISWLGIIFLKTPMKLCSIWDVNISLTLLQGCMVFTFVIIFQVMSVAQPTVAQTAILIQLSSQIFEEFLGCVLTH